MLKPTTLVVALGCFALAACGVTEKISEAGKIDYRSARSGPALDVPPDLVSPRSDDRYNVPARPGETTLSGFQRGQEARQTAVNTGQVLPTVEGVRLERSGTQRWLVVNRPPETVWPLIRQFWTDSGFVASIDSSQNGIFETDWAENRAKLPQDAVRRTIGRVFDGLYSTGERDKFRTRIERAGDSTEVYLTHRGMEEVYEGRDKVRTIWVPRAADPELENEFLRRLMARLGVSAEKAASVVQAAASPSNAAAKPERAVIANEGGVQRLAIAENFDQAWRQLSLALDRGGFTVEDRDRSKGLFYVRYVDPESQAKLSEKPGFFGRVFGAGSRLEQTERFQLNVQRAGESTTVEVFDAKGAKVPSADQPTVNKILALLRTQLN